ncbi:hypothetical protein JI435_022890 [Parastagonospora nodorum SN15]|uniref:Extradiol ring-cleavage dioxygenase class III enzyme subunit B domain-containing protein n=1 Tax=Phaeosphaeria nodorum (strain SN15 / ATCC MYA-4574 / FGSC 10173) TaxID=321614 RepID=A0A7U2HVS7_PHANO|nr:hypothetical protein JI435_022890 [Parastagonospora nodorum SN15]
MTRLAPVISLSHGGGPMPLLGDPSHRDIVDSLKTKLPKILKLGTQDAPKAIVLVTAHWSTDKVTVSSGSRHGLLYDYYGFPPESYEIKHDAPGSPEVAGEVQKALGEAGIECKQDAERGMSYSKFSPTTESNHCCNSRRLIQYPQAVRGPCHRNQILATLCTPSGRRNTLSYFPSMRYAPHSATKLINRYTGWDHGVFVPMKLVDPSATIPIVQLSVLASESASQSYAIGRALSTLRAQNIAIIGSGFATLHNLRLMFSGESSTPAFKQKNADWSGAVTDAAMTDDDEARARKFEGWREWPNAYTMHPRGGAEHFLPLIVCAGAARTTKGRKYADDFRGVDMWSYYWGEDE